MPTQATNVACPAEGGDKFDGRLRRPLRAFSLKSAIFLGNRPCRGSACAEAGFNFRGALLRCNPQGEALIKKSVSFVFIPKTYKLRSSVVRNQARSLCWTSTAPSPSTMQPRYVSSAEVINSCTSLGWRVNTIADHDPVCVVCYKISVLLHRKLNEIFHFSRLSP